jgi:hypothetical protein
MKSPSDFQSTYGSKGPDITWMTGRLAISVFAEDVPESLAYSAEEAMRAALVETTKRRFAVYNVSQRWVAASGCM